MEETLIRTHSKVRDTTPPNVCPALGMQLIELLELRSDDGPFADSRRLTACGNMDSGGKYRGACQPPR
jgi:hypothetical protein